MADPEAPAAPPDTSSRLAETLARLEKRVSLKKPDKFPARQQVPTSAIQRQLPLWPEQRRGVPNDLVRGALFTVGNSRNERPFLNRELVASLSGTNIKYTGQELRQDDQDVLLQILHLARLVPLGSPVMFTAHAMLTALKWNPNVRSYARLQAILNRLCATSVEVQTADRGYAGSLIRDFCYTDAETGEKSRVWSVRLEPEIAALFASVSFSQIEWEQRLSLGPLAKWLHSFYHTHRAPYPMKVETIRRLCGSATKDLSKFRQLLRSALKELHAIAFLESYNIDNKDLVQVVRASAPVPA